MSYVAVDVEATGLDINRNEVVSIDAIDIETGKKFYVECRPENFESISEEALKVNGFTVEQLKSIQTTKKEAMEGLIKFLDGFNDAIIVGYCVSFDVTMLYKMAHSVGIEMNHLPHKCIDNAEIVVQEFYKKRSILGSDIIIKRGEKDYVRSRHALTVLLEMENEPNPHNALNGAIYAGEIFSRIVMHEPLRSGSSQIRDIPEKVNTVDVTVWDYMKDCRLVVSEYQRLFDLGKM